MKKYASRIVALILCVAIITSLAVCSAISVGAETTADLADTGASNIIIHVKGAIGGKNFTPYIYYWNALPTDKEVAYPGTKMTADSSQVGGNWYTYTFSNTTKINFLVTDGTTGLSGQKSEEQTANNAGEYWFKDGRLKTVLCPVKYTVQI